MFLQIFQIYPQNFKFSHCTAAAVFYNCVFLHVGVHCDVKIWPHLLIWLLPPNIVIYITFKVLYISKSLYFFNYDFISNLTSKHNNFFLYCSDLFSPECATVCSWVFLCVVVVVMRTVVMWSADCLSLNSARRFISFSLNTQKHTVSLYSSL